ncbi:MAG: DUF2459 domain-containing protein [Bacteroidota bacterium]
MKIVKTIIKWILYFFCIPLSYLIISLILSYITVDRKIQQEDSSKSVYLNTNGIHLDIVIPVENVDSLLQLGLKRNRFDKYLSFGWGDEDFYLNTQNWSDLTFGNAFKAVFLKSSTLMHVTRYRSKQPDWIEVKVTEAELRKLNVYILNSFLTDESGEKIILENRGYSSIDDFYKAKGSYSGFKTCNSWVNAGFKASGLKSCLWTPFDFGLMNKYQ